MPKPDTFQRRPCRPGAAGKMRLATLISVTAGLLASSGCSPLPDLGPAARGAGALPAVQLVPIDTILAQADALAGQDPGTGSLESRAAALRARAERLRRM